MMDGVVELCGCVFNSDAGGLPAWLIAVIAASSALVCALVAVIIYFVAKRT